MKSWIVLCIGAFAVLPVSARVLTSADGSKTVEAEVIGYNPTTGKVVIRPEGANRPTTVDASAFSARDQAYFMEFLAEAAKRKSLTIRAEKRSEKPEKSQGGLYIYDRRTEAFSVRVSNGSPVGLEGLRAKYDIYTHRFDKEGGRVLDVVSGSEEIASLDGNYAHEFVTAPVQVTVGCATTSSCPKCKTHAASVKSERVIGIHVRLYDSDDVMLGEYYSAGAVKSAMMKRARAGSAGKAGV